MRDLSAELTVFSLTVGKHPALEEHRACLHRQTVRFRHETIADHTPMSAAFNEMLRRCSTPWFIQVDEDMLLFPSTVEALFDRIQPEPSTTAIVAAPLWDCQVLRPLLGVKIYRSEVVRSFTFRDTLGCDRALNAELQAAGYTVTRLPMRWSREQCLGEHGKYLTPALAFIRWQRLFAKRRHFGGRRDWIAPWPARFLKRYRQSGDEIDLYSFLGATLGACGAPVPDRELDAHHPPEELEHVRQLLAAGTRWSGALHTFREQATATRGRFSAVLQRGQRRAGSTSRPR